MIVLSEAEDFPFTVKMSSNEKKMKKQHTVFSTEEKMQISTKVEVDMGTHVDLVVMFGLLVSSLNTIVNKWPETEKSYSRCGPSFFKGPKTLKTLPLEELETILSTWFKQVHTANTSIDRPHLKVNALHVAALLSINSFWASSSWINCLRRDTTWYTRLCQ